MTIEDFEKEKSKYIKLKSSINSIILNLKSFSTNVVGIKNKVINNYVVNGDNPPVLNRIIKLANNSNQLKGYLSKTIIPSIDAAIKKCDLEIQKLKAAEASAIAAAIAAANRSAASTNV